LIQCYELLGQSDLSSDESIRRAYRKLSAKFHPDKSPKATASEKKKLEQQFRAIQEAYATIMRSREGAK
jgi:curved DNA-binding protein CbpA